MTLTLPLAHLGHYLWILYLLPVIFVIAGILKTTLAEKRREEEEPPGDEAGEEGSDDD